MTEYENREIPEGINVSPTHPLKEFAILVAGISTLIIIAVIAMSLLAGQLARYIPFAQEKNLALKFGEHWPKPTQNAVEQKRAIYLQALADRIALAMDLPPEMNITVHYSTADTINAMATLGGNIIIFQGLIDTLPSENALAMVVAHEIAHVKNRHPIVAIGRGFAAALTLSSLSGMGDGLVQQWVSGLGMLPVLSFNRGQEEEADADALTAIFKTYGHVGDAAAFFEYIAREKQVLGSPALFNTHPGHEARIKRINDFAKSHVLNEGSATTPLPDYLRHKR